MRMASAKSYPSSLLVNVEELIKLQGVESQRVEFKKAWNNRKDTLKGTYWQVLHTITAFANDLYNVNGGYIIIGVEEKKKRPLPDSRQDILSPLGIRGNVEEIQKRIFRACRENITHEIYPILQPVFVDGKKILVIWVRPSDNRPHMCRESDGSNEWNCYIREGAETKKAKPEQISLLHQYSGAPPFDDRKVRSTGKVH